MSHKHIIVPSRHKKLSREILDEHFHSNVHFERNWTDDVADFLTQKFGTVIFLIGNFIFFGLWLFINAGFAGMRPFDPFPFNFLTMIVSLEAIFLSVTVLISQNRQSHIADIRQQMDFEIDVRAEEEITKILAILDDMRAHAGIAARDPELEQMKLKIDIQEMQKEAEKNGS